MKVYGTAVNLGYLGSELKVKTQRNFFTLTPNIVINE